MKISSDSKKEFVSKRRGNSSLFLKVIMAVSAVLLVTVLLVIAQIPSAEDRKKLKEVIEERKRINEKWLEMDRRKREKISRELGIP